MNVYQPSVNRRSGFALLLVLILAGVSLLILSAAMYRNSTVVTLNSRNNEYNTCANAAEAAVEKDFARIAYDFQSYGVARGVNNNTSGIYLTNIPTAGEDSYWSQFLFSDARGNANRTDVNFAYGYTGPLPSAYTGLFASSGSAVYRIVSNVQMTNSLYNVIGTAQEDVLLALVPLTTWAIFYNGLLEFTQCADMIVNGPVQANGQVYVGTTASLTFNSGVSCTTNLTAPFVDGLSSGWTPGTASTSCSITFNGGYVQKRRQRHGVAGHDQLPLHH